MSKETEESTLIKAGDTRVLLGYLKMPPKVDCRVISEELYQKMKQALDLATVSNQRELLIATVVKKINSYTDKEVDMVINIGQLKGGNYDYVEKDVRAVVDTAKRRNVLTKVIIETALLTDDEKVRASLISKNAGADFVKTSTGFSTGGATVGDVALMKYVVGRKIGVKAAGGIRSREDADALIASGADRIGASASVKIVSGEVSHSTY